MISNRLQRVLNGHFSVHPIRSTTMKADTKIICVRVHSTCARVKVAARGINPFDTRTFRTHGDSGELTVKFLQSGGQRREMNRETLLFSVGNSDSIPYSDSIPSPHKHRE